MNFIENLAHLARTFHRIFS